MKYPTIDQIKEVYAYQAMQAKNLFLHNSKRFLEFEYFEEPKISIVILGYNKAEYTFRCLESILAYVDVPYELILVDNASKDDTRLLFSRTKNAKIILNDENLFFMRGNNEAAKQARAPYVLFLNNDTQISVNTLSEMFETMISEERCGVVGCKLVQQNGKIQEAGSIFWANGKNHEYARDYDPLSSECSYLREADYCGGACFLIKKDLFLELGGFSTEWEPAYYEETDLCVKVKKQGYRVLFQPSVYVFHNENTSSSPERAKELCQRHSDKFDVKWRSYLLSQGYDLYSGNDILQARDRRKLPTLLIVVEDSLDIVENRIPDLSFNALKQLAKENKTTVLSLKSSPALVSVGLLEKNGVEVFYGFEEFNSVKNERMKYYQQAIFCLSDEHQYLVDDLKDYYNFGNESINQIV